MDEGFPRLSDLRIGFGTDLHLLRPGDGLWLGGVLVPCRFAFKAVSDGDVLLHALVDAMLGCAGLGDIGGMYPESRVTPGESSRRFVEEVGRTLSDRGFRVVNADCVIDLDAVRLGEWKGRIRDSVAALLRIDASRVNVKAKTAEGVGAVGEGRAASAQVALLAACAPGGGE